VLVLWKRCSCCNKTKFVHTPASTKSSLTLPLPSFSTSLLSLSHSLAHTSLLSLPLSQPPPPPRALLLFPHHSLSVPFRCFFCPHAPLLLFSRTCSQFYYITCVFCNRMCSLYAMCVYDLLNSFMECVLCRTCSLSKAFSVKSALYRMNVLPTECVLYSSL
jgi:hypothetical protein